MKECKLCHKNAVVNSDIIPGLCCCRMCGRFFFEEMATDTTLSVGQILREEIKLSGYKDTILTHDSIHVVAQLRHVDAVMMHGLTIVLDSCSHVISELMGLSQVSYDSATRSLLCHRIASETGLNDRIAAYIVDTYAYALKLTDETVEYTILDSSADKLRIISFVAEREAVKMGEPVKLFWEVNMSDAVVAITDGTHQWSVPASGTMSVTPQKDKTYTLTAMREGKSVAPQTVKVHIMKPVKINSFKVSKQRVFQGQTINVSWKVSGATHIELMVNDGYEYRHVEDVTSLKSKEVRPGRDCQIVLICSNDCYQELRSISVEVTSIPRFPIQELASLKHLPELKLHGLILPASFGSDPLMSKRFFQLRESQKGLYHSLKERILSAFKHV